MYIFIQKLNLLPLMPKSDIQDKFSKRKNDRQRRYVASNICARQIIPTNQSG